MGFDSTTTGVSVHSLNHLLSVRAQADPEQSYTFLRDGAASDRITPRDLDRRARAIARWLGERAREGDRAILLYPPGIDFLAAFFGCLYARLIPAPLPLPAARTGLDKLALVQQDTGAKLALTVSALADDRFGVAAPGALRIEATDTVDDSLAEGFAPRAAGSTETAYLQYTSGSTSAPRGVMISHANVLSNLAYIDAGFMHSPDSVVVSWLPHFHDMGLIYGLLAPLYQSIPGYFMSPAAFVQRPRFWLETITRYRATHSGGPNFAYDLCVRRVGPDERQGLDLSSWEVAFNGAEPVHAETLDRFSKAFAGCGFRRQAFYPAYGLAEASLKVSGGAKSAEPVIFAAGLEALARNRVEAAPPGGGDVRAMVGCGAATGDTIVRIVDPETLRPCGPDQVGEIWVSGPGVATGYWNRPEETAQTFGARLADDGNRTYLRTGDLGFLRQGELFIAGRLKDLIIIRGLNHHPTDIELTARRAHPAVAASIAAAFSIETSGEERLVIAVEAGRHELENPEEVARAVRQAVAEKHEVRTHAFVLVKKGGIPRTSSGKVQRRLCRLLYLRGELSVVFESVAAGAAMTIDEPPLTRDSLLAAAEADRPALVETYLVNQVARVLKLDPAAITPGEPLTALGIDSVASVELQNRIETDLGVTVTAAEMIEGATIGRLASRIAEEIAAQAPPVQPLPRLAHSELPLSFVHDRLWLPVQIAPGNAAYHIPFAFRIDGPLELPALERALATVVARQESLRSSFVTKDGQPALVVSPSADARIRLIDLTGVPPAERVDEALDLAAHDVRKAFDLSRGPLFRFRLYRLSDTEHLALLVMHHVISDVWSVRLLIEELMTAYQAAITGEEPALDPLPVQYGDFAAWQRRELRDEKLGRLTRFWRDRLAGAPLLELATDRPHPKAPAFAAGSESLVFPPELAEKIRHFCREEGFTLFTVLFGAFTVLAARCSGQTDLVLGVTNANRNRPELERLIGFFAAPLVVRSEISPGATFRDALRDLRRDLLETYAHQELPFAKVVESAHPGRQSTYTPLFHVMFSLVRALLPDLNLPDLDLKAVEIGAGATDFDLFVNVVEERGDLRALAVYSKDLYDSGTVSSLMEAYLRILKDGVASPDRRVSEFDLPARLIRRIEEPKQVPVKPAITISATFTSEPVEEVLAFWMRELQFDYRIKFAPYNQIFQQLLDPGSPIYRNRTGVNVLLVRLEDWIQQRGEPDLDRLGEDVRHFAEYLKSAAERAAAPFLVCLCPPSPALLSNPVQAPVINRLESLIAAEFRNGGSVHVTRSETIARLYPVEHYYDPHGERLGHVPYTPEFFAALGTVIARGVHAMRTAPFKVIVLDCDQTLWSGVCGEDGPEGVVIDEPRRALQQFMLEQAGAGMLLAIASKNNEDDVWATFAAHPEMPLRREHFVAWRIDWDRKSDNLREIADELQLGLDTFIFVDDSPTECAEVEANCPEVLTLQLPQDARQIPGFLRHVWAFDHLTTTEEDKKRTAMYGQRLERLRLQQQVVTLDQFLDGLQINIEIGPVELGQVSRVSQLTQRTNQFNLTTIRRTEAEVRRFLDENGGECLAAHVSDRFGAYGLVGVILCAARDGVLDVDTFLLSCRALGRGVEHAMLARAGELAVERGLETVRLRYSRTAKNKPALKFLEDVAGGRQLPPDEKFVLDLPAREAAALTYRPDSAPGEPVEERARTAPPAGVAMRTIDYPRIATEMNSAAGILGLVRAEARANGASTAQYEPPRTPLERQLARIWSEMLNVPQVGVNDNFFDLGGHSLLAVQLLSRIRETFDVDLSLDVVFTGVFSVAELAKAIELHEIERAGSDEYAALLAEVENLSDEEVRALLEREQGAPKDEESGE